MKPHRTKALKEQLASLKQHVRSLTQEINRREEEERRARHLSYIGKAYRDGSNLLLFELREGIVHFKQLVVGIDCCEAYDWQTWYDFIDLGDAKEITPEEFKAVEKLISCVYQYTHGLTWSLFTGPLTPEVLNEESDRLIETL